MKRTFRAIPKQRVTASWNGIFSPKYIMDQSNISNRSVAKQISEYLWQKGVDCGFDNRDECYRLIEKYDGGFDGIYEKMKSEGFIQ